jgi:hypothetical protein
MGSIGKTISERATTVKDTVKKAVTSIWESKLIISSWNVCGLGDKIEDPLFLENVTSDINILLETWKDDSDKYKVIASLFQ